MKPKPGTKSLSKFANKRSDIQKEQDRVNIAHWYLKGETQVAIADRLGISRAQVAQDLQLIQHRWKEAAIRDFDEHKAEQLARLDQVEREYWTAWELSKQTRKRISRKMIKAETEKRKRNSENPEMNTVEQNVSLEEQYGDPRYLQGVESVIDKRCRIFGLYAPTKIGVQDLDEMIRQELERVAGKQDDIDQPLASELMQ